MKKKAKWKSPELIILARAESGETVLVGCKTGSGGAGSCDCVIQEYGECLGNGTSMMDPS
jgi:hypothetical protein